ncbi:uncharacterized protein [Montipora capricornis]|uniref:uncharacterized protein n=1 Tax=Montipora capricornis TaxID=246305 RepID=UPI0035F16D6F
MTDKSMEEKARNARRAAKSSFTRTMNAVSMLMKAERPANEIQQGLVEAKNAYSDLVIKHEEYTMFLNDESYEDAESWMMDHKQCKKPRRSRDGRYFRRTLGQRTENEEVSLSSEDEEISKDEEVFKNAYKKQLVVQASSHQGDNSLVFHHAGQQCAGIAFISLLYSTIHPVGTWREQDLDKLLIAGDRLHFFQVCCLRYKVAVNQKLHVDELPNKLRAFGYDFHVDTEIVGGTTMQEREDEDVLELQQVLEKSVQQNSFGFVLRFEDYCVACINSYG